jgi:hypothetical protein
LTVNAPRPTKSAKKTETIQRAASEKSRLVRDLLCAALSLNRVGRLAGLRHRLLLRRGQVLMVVVVVVVVVVEGAVLLRGPLFLGGLDVRSDYCVLYSSLDSSLVCTT